MNIIDSPSPNQNDRPPGVRPRLIVIHGTVGTDVGDLNHLRDARAEVSYHYLIQRDGTIHRLVRPERRAWHAGKSVYKGVEDVNDFSIGIGLSNLGPNSDERFFTEAQYASAGWLTRELRGGFNIPASETVGHFHISPGRKTDPWPYFDWKKLEQYAGGEVPKIQPTVTIGPIREVRPGSDDLRGLRLDRIEIPSRHHVDAIVRRNEIIPAVADAGLGVALIFLKGVIAGEKANLETAVDALEEYLQR